MNGNTPFPLYDSAPDPSTESPERSALLHWLPPQYEHASLASQAYPHSETQASFSVPNTLPPSMALFQQYHQQASGPAQLLEHPARDEVLSPLPLSGMQQLYEDRVTPPTPPVLESFIAPARPSRQGAFPSLTPAHNTGVLPTPSSTMSYLSIPSSGSYDSPYNPFTSSFATSPSPYSQPSCMGSPGVASPSTYYSFNSPGMASGSSYYSLSPTSPAMQIGSAYCSPAQAGPSTLPSLPYFSVQPSPATSAASTLLPRISIPQTVDVTSKWHRSFMERFSIGGIPGIPVREVVKDCVAVDRADERVLVKTGARQIRLVIAWPGYKHHGTYIPVQDDQGFITRGQLAKRICTHLSRFVKRIANGKTHPTREHARWAIGKNGYSVDHLWLLSVSPAQKNIWLAELEVHQ